MVNKTKGFVDVRLWQVSTNLNTNDKTFAAFGFKLTQKLLNIIKKKENINNQI